MNLTAEQKKTILAAYLGWMLDAFDFFLLTFLLKDIAKEFGVDVPAVAYALFLTLAMRFVGAFIFGRIGDHWGRKPALMLDILCYSISGARRLLSEPLGVPRLARAVRNRDGRRMGPRQLAGDEVIPPQARGTCPGFCNPDIRAASWSRRSSTACSTAARLATSLSAGGRCSCSASSPPSSCCSSAAPCRIAGVRSVQGARETRTLGDRRPAQGTGPLHGRANDVLQPVQPWHAGPLSDLLPEAAQFRSDDGELDHHCRRSRRDRRRARVRPRFGENRPRQCDHVAALIALPTLPLWAYASTPVLLALGAFIMQVAVQGAGAWSRSISMNVARARRAPPSRPSSIRPATSSPPTTGRSRLRSPRRTAATTPRAGVVAGVVAVAMIVVIRFSPEKRGHVLTAH